MKLRIAEGCEDKAAIQELFTEYTTMLFQADKRLEDYLSMQNYDEEYLHPEMKYGRPLGRLYIVYNDQTPAGCIALKRMDDERCEMKRMYVREAYRSMGLGSLLVERILRAAEEIGYKEMYLDTFPQLQSAVRLYQRHGFELTERYNDSPLDTTIFMKKKLGQHGTED